MDKARMGRLAAGVAGLVLASAAFATATHATATRAAAASASSAVPGAYVAITPTRILDTRSGLGAPEAAVPARGTIAVTVTGAAGVPDPTQVSAVVFNLTVTRSTAPGYVSAYPAGQSAPATSSVNFAAGETRAHEVVVAPGTGGQVALLNGTDGTLDLVADISGYYTAGTPAAAGGFAALAPARILDTRSGLGAPKAPLAFPGDTSFVHVGGQGGVPATGVSAVVLNVTATNPTGPGYLTVDERDTADTSTVNFRTGQTVSNLVLAPLDVNGDISLTGGGSVNGTVDAVADVSGYYLAGAPAGAGLFGAVLPVRLLDTRHDPDSAVPVPARGTITLTVAGRARIPATGVTAAILNVTVVRSAASGYLTVYPSGAARPLASTVNFAGLTVANQTIVPVGSDGTIKIYNGSARATNVLVDASGFVGPLPGPLRWSGLNAFAAGSVVTSVSCTSATFCLALDGTAVLRFDGSSWSTPQSVGTQTLFAISCVSPTFCAATSASSVYLYNGTTWAQTPLALSYLSSVSCASSTFCVITVGFDQSTKTWVYNGSTWRAVDTGDPSAPGYGELQVSCPTTTFCMATYGSGGVVLTFNGTTWTKRTSPQLDAVWCPSATFCAGVSYDQAATFNGTTWTTPVSIDLSTPVDEFVAVRCASTTSCVALTGQGALVFYNGSAWTSPVLVAPISANDGLLDLSCPTTSFCALVDNTAALLGT